MSERVGYITNPDYWGMILTFIDPMSDKSFAEQFNDHYISGFATREGADYVVWDAESVDHAKLHTAHFNETYNEQGRIEIGDELAIIFDYAMVATRTGQGPWTIARMN